MTRLTVLSPILLVACLHVIFDCLSNHVDTIMAISLHVECCLNPLSDQNLSNHHLEKQLVATKASHDLITSIMLILACAPIDNPDISDNPDNVNIVDNMNYFDSRIYN